MPERYGLSNAEIRELARRLCRVAIEGSITISASIDAVADQLLAAPALKGRVVIRVSSGGTETEYAFPEGLTPRDILGALDAIRYLLAEYENDPAAAIVGMDALAALGRKKASQMNFAGATV